MSQEVVNGNINDILNAIKEVQDKNIYPIFIPSLEKNVMFREMNTKQEKMIVKTIVDSPVYNSEFIFAMKAIINENCTEVIDIDSLTLIDKTAICLTMRMKSVGNTFEYNFKDTDKSKTINIEDYITKFKKIKIPKNKVIKNDGITVLCGIPTIKVEFDLEQEFRKNVDNLDVGTVAEARKAIGIVFTNEIVKYIKEITIIRDSNEMKLNMDDYDFKTRIAILEELGNKITNKIMEYIEESNKKVKEALKIELELNDSEQKEYNTKKLTSVLETGSDFFIIS